jgi:1-acyl-sn-glycerol-3-phosphate acyltransferase
MKFYRALRTLVVFLVSLLTRFRVRGANNIPHEGPCIIAANHFHALDPVMLAVAVKRPVHFMAKEEIFHWPVVGWIARRAGVFPVKRGKVDVQAVRQSLELLAEGGIVGIFPEGHRSKTGEMQEALNGAALLSARSGAPIIPVALSGRYRPAAKFKVNIGQPMQIESETAGRPTALERAAGTKLLMQNIALLLEQCREESW